MHKKQIIPTNIYHGIMTIPQYLVDFVNVFGGITSLIVGILSIALSVVFYVAAKRSEIESAKLLSQINERVETLRTINNSLLGTTIQHLASSNSKMIDKVFLAIGPERYAGNLKSKESNEDYLDSAIINYIYSSRAFYFASVINDTTLQIEENKEIIDLAKLTMDMSKKDFYLFGNYINNVNQETIKAHRLYDVFEDTNTRWKNYIDKYNTA